MFAIFISSSMINTLCWTLLHSLWLGAAFAVLAAILLLSTRKAKAVVRYNVLLALFILFIASVGGAYYLVAQEQVRTAITVDAISAAALSQNRFGMQPITVALNRSEMGGLNTVFDWLDAHARWIVLGWVFVMGLKCLRMGFDFWYIRRLCRQQIKEPALYWHERIQHLAQGLRIRRPIRFLESAIVSVPTTVGFLKPIVLMPLGLLAQLPPEHIEAVLLHELAHIRRNDYLINLLQSVAEIVFFFNPALLWLSTLIRTERENCCDDIALAAVKNKTQYIRALVAFQEFHLGTTPYALAFAESKTPLLDRIKRILYHHNIKKLSIMEKISLSVSILLVGAIAFLPLANTKAQQDDALNTTTFSRVNIMGEGVENDPQVIYLRETDGKTYVITRVNKEITDLYVNGKKIEPAQYGDYSAMIKKIDEQIERDVAMAKLDAEQAALDAKQAQLDQEQAVRDAEQALRDAKQAQLDAEQALRDAAEANIDREHSMRDAQQAKIDAEQARLDVEQAKRDAAQAKLDAEQALRDQEQAKRDAEQAKRDAAEDMVMQKKMEAMAIEMVTDQIVSSREKINSFALTDTEFIVNGIKQERLVHEKYKGRYLAKPGFGIYYNFEFRGTKQGYFYNKKKRGL
jgi:bla regulator protein blaR1